jgi:glycosyltransferase involved in cell wall biosynthesis
MKILLVGEYSRLHNSLKEGLAALGHEVLIVSTGDSFKKYDSDLDIAAKTTQNSRFLSFARKAVHRLAGADIARLEHGLRFYRLLPKLKGYDYVQLINSDALETHPKLAKWLLKKLLKQNGPMSLLVCGDETPVIEYALRGGGRYSIVTPYLADKSLEPLYAYTLKYAQKPYRRLFEWVSAQAKCIITSDLDYQLPMQHMGFSTTLIPNPVNTRAIAFTQPEATGKVVIFLGINRHSYIKKGLVFFEEALAIIKQKYPGKAEVLVAENVPYKDYIHLYNRAHIVLDQVYAYDQGYNALEAMAKGKVVFTGAEAEFNTHYSLDQPVAINALPNAHAIAAELGRLIENPGEIAATGHRARAFVEKEHDYIKVAGMYLAAWQK